ncbi:MAG: trigger factor [Candidatus Magasanikbacteria bacterium]|nr:trigger factor [Candidatus Magasanikbacteria bacterium]NCS72055.1 trigger factor [Candidatus Magasanikbacteria bacterium]
MKHTTKKIDGGQLEITITVSPKTQEKFLKKAAKALSEKKPIKGFRKGTAPYEVITKEFGELSILQEALHPLVSSALVEVVKKESLDTVGSPAIDVEKMAPGNDFIFKATVALLPKVTITDIKKIKLTSKQKPITEKDLEETLEALRGMKATEIITDKTAKTEDKVVVDMSMAIDNVPVEGGDAKDYQVYLSEKHYIPGFNEHLVGLKKGDTKEFSLTFPKDHYQKLLAGKKVEFKVTVKDVFVRELPELNDAFAQLLGQKTFKELKELIKQNREHEEQQKFEQTQEIELLDQLTDKSTFEEIPDVIVNHEKEKIFVELKQSLEKNGITIEQYLQDIKKDEKTLFAEFTEQATKRAKAAIVSRQIAKDHTELSATEEELEKEIEKLKLMYENHEHKPDFERSDIKDTIANSIQNRKVIQWLKEQVITK